MEFSVETYAELCKPFPVEVIELLPGATTEDKTRALALAYVDMRACQTRLDTTVGPGGWYVAYRPWGENACICTLTILGLTREDVGEEKLADPNCHTSAVAQAFKRTCSSFGLGRYLYDLPAIWAPYDAKKKTIVNSEAVIRDIYRQAGLLDEKPPARGTKGGIFGTPQARPAPAPAAAAAPARPLESLGDLQAATEVELKRVGWGPGEGRAHIATLYGVGSRSGLTIPQYQEFLEHLRKLPSAPYSAAPGR